MDTYHFSVISGSFWNYFFVYCGIDVARDTLDKFFQNLASSLQI